MKDPKPFGAKSRGKYSSADLKMIDSYLSTPAGRRKMQGIAKREIKEGIQPPRPGTGANPSQSGRYDVALTKAKEAAKNKRLAGKPKKK